MSSPTKVMAPLKTGKTIIEAPLSPSRYSKHDSNQGVSSPHRNSQMSMHSPSRLNNQSTLRRSPMRGQAQLQYRLTELREPRDKSIQVAYDAKFPQVFSFDNPLIGILAHKRDTSFNFMFLSGDQTEYPCLDINLTEMYVPEGAIIRKVRLREYYDTESKNADTLVQSKVSPKVVKLQK